MMRIALFLLTNLAVMVVFGLVLSLTGIQSSSVQGLLIMALLFGFGGSFISLLMSKWMALKSVGGEVIEQPRNDMEQWLMNTVAQQSRQAGIAMPQVAIYHARTSTRSPRVPVAMRHWLLSAPDCCRT
jgi:heat shock protein HtpX